ncbi:MAG: AAA family ATPase [Gammaproteobacteria bacterium]|nr:AAA family ATPase [Gammaproteobacteria bacterium]
MECPECQTENREGRHFCAKCGAPLAVTCPECGFANEPDVDFCGGCGRALSAIAASPTDGALKHETREPERRQLTVMFCDLVGSTALAERLDPEELHALLAQYQDTCADVIQCFDGYIARYVGDGLLVYFGYPQAHEDDPQRAVRTGLGIVEAIQDLDTKLTNPHVNLAVRIGIATGLVVAGDIGSGERREEKAVVGKTPNLAARLQTLAQPNTVLIGASTQRLVEGLFDCDDLGPQRLKGISEPGTAYRVRQESRAPKRVRTPFVGRRAELRQFAGVIEACGETGNGHAIYVRGEAGIGKTRLVEEFIANAEQAGFVSHKGLVFDFGVGKGQDAIRALVRSLLGIEASSDKPARQVVAGKVFADSLLRSEQRVFLNDLLDLPQSTEMRAMYDAMDNATRNRGKREVVTGLIKEASGRQSILVTIEDVHWADALTLAHLGAITSVIRDCPAVLLMTARIEGDPLDQAWRSTVHGSPLMTIDLAPLRQAEAIALASAFIDASKRVVMTCIERAQGNPLFLEQLLRDAEESGAESVPASIESLVLARIDRLTPADKQALQAASVIGQRFSRETLHHLLDDPAYDCTPLIAHHLVRPMEEHYLFAHALIQEAVYASLLKTRRRELHRRVGQWFSDRDPVLYAQHLDRAEDPAAPRAYLEAVKTQAADYRYERALQLVNRALEIAPESDSFMLRCLEGELLRNLGSVPESIDAYRRASEVAVDEVDRCRAWIGVAESLRLTEQHDELLEALDHAEVIAKARDLSVELARIFQLRGKVHFMRGEIDSCLWANTISLEHARVANSPEVEAQALGDLGDAEYARGRVISAYGYFHQCIELSREHGFGRIVTANLPMRASAQLYRNQLEAALDDVRAAFELAKKIRQPRAEMIAAVVGVYIASMGNPTEGKDWNRASLNVARRIGSRIYEATNLAYMGRFAAQEGARLEAQKLAQEAVAIMRDSGMGFLGPYVLGTLALVTDDPDRRRAALKEGQELLRSGSIAHNHLWFYRDAMEVCLQMAEWDDVGRYAEALEDYTSAEPLPWSDFFIARGRALAAYGQGERTQSTMQELRRLRDEAERAGLTVALPKLEDALSGAQTLV